MNWLDRFLLAAKVKALEFKNDERGVEGFVVAIVLILIGVLLCALFWDNISGWFTDMWNRITGATDPIG